MTKYFSRGKKLAEFITQKAWTKSEFARKMEIYPQNVNAYLAGMNDPLSLADKLLREGCDLNWLCSDDVTAVKEEKGPYTAEEEKEIDELANKYLELYSVAFGPAKLDREGRRARLAILRKLAEEDVRKRRG